MAPSPHRLVLVDLLRFVAALLVLCFHYGFRGEQGSFVPSLGLPGWVTASAPYGGMGVYLFFVISGFVIAYSAHDRPAFGFAASRFARLYPTYILAMSLTALVLLAAGQAVSPGQYIANLTLFPKLLHQPMVDGVYWSIQYEVLFYAWVFVLMLLGVFQRWTHGLLAGWLAIAALNTFMLHSGALALLFLTPYASLFSAGILLFRLREEGRTRSTLLLLGLAILLSCVIGHQEAKETFELYNIPYSPLVFALVMLAFYAALIFATQSRRVLPSASAMVALGALTYPLYLLHQMVGFAVITTLSAHIGGAGAVIVTTVVMLALAAIVHWGFEKPIVPAVRRGLETLFARMGLQIQKRAASQQPFSETGVKS